MNAKTSFFITFDRTWNGYNLGMKKIIEEHRGYLLGGATAFFWIVQRVDLQSHEQHSTKHSHIKITYNSFHSNRRCYRSVFGDHNPLNLFRNTSNFFAQSGRTHSQPKALGAVSCQCHYYFTPASSGTLQINQPSPATRPGIRKVGKIKWVSTRVPMWPLVGLESVQMG